MSEEKEEKIEEEIKVKRDKDGNIIEEDVEIKEEKKSDQSSLLIFNNWQNTRSEDSLDLCYQKITI